MSWLSLRRVTRETRLLAATLVVSSVVLFLLARLQYPTPEPDGAATQPLERLTAVADSDDLVNAIATLQSRVLPSLVTLRVDVNQARAGFEPLAWRAPAEHLPRFVLGLRVRNDRAIAILPPGARVQAMIGARDAPTIVSRDPVTGVVLLEAAPQTAAAMLLWDSGALAGRPRYVAAAEATRGGPTLVPLFLGGSDMIHEPRWGARLLAIGGAGAAPIGSFAFALDGRLAGAVVETGGAAAVVPADTLKRVADHLTEGKRLMAGDLGLTTQALTPELAAATGARVGVVAAFVDPTGPTAKTVRIGDVLLAIGGERVYSPDELDTRVARTPPGTAVKLSTMRDGRRLEIEATVRPHEGGASEKAAGLGLVLRPANGLGAEILRVLPRSAAAYAGLAPGDLITQVEGESRPAPGTVQRLYQQAKPDQLLVVGVERRGKHLVVAVRR